LSNLANRQTDRQTLRAIAYTSSFVRGKLHTSDRRHLVASLHVWIRVDKNLSFHSLAHSARRRSSSIFFGHTGYVTLLQCHIYVNNDVD